MLGGSFSTQFFVGPITPCRLSWPSGPCSRVDWWLCGYREQWHTAQERLLACFVLVFIISKWMQRRYWKLLVFITASFWQVWQAARQVALGPSPCWALEAKLLSVIPWRRQLPGSLWPPVLRDQHAACQGNPFCGEHAQLFSLGADREQPQKLQLGEQWQRKLLLLKSKPSTTAQKFPGFFHQAHRLGCYTKTLLHF